MRFLNRLLSFRRRQPRILQRIQRPQVLARHRKRGGAISLHRHAADVFEQFLGALHIGEEERPRLVVGPKMRHAVRRQLVTVLHDILDQLRIALGDPAQGEKSGAAEVGRGAARMLSQWTYRDE